MILKFEKKITGCLLLQTIKRSFKKSKLCPIAKVCVPIVLNHGLIDLRRYVVFVLRSLKFDYLKNYANSRSNYLKLSHNGPKLGRFFFLHKTSVFVGV